MGLNLLNSASQIVMDEQVRNYPSSCGTRHPDFLPPCLQELVKEAVDHMSTVDFTVSHTSDTVRLVAIHEERVEPQLTLVFVQHIRDNHSVPGRPAQRIRADWREVPGAPRASRDTRPEDDHWLVSSESTVWILPVGAVSS